MTQLDVSALLNASDDVERGNAFLIVTGTSAEAGDDGEVGPGNRVGGVISPYRPMTLEAAAGKNPVNHCGKLYSLVATRVADEIVRVIPDVTDATCVLLSQIGRPIDDPQVADVCVASKKPAAPVARSCVADLLRAELANLPALCDLVLSGQFKLF